MTADEGRRTQAIDMTPKARAEAHHAREQMLLAAEMLGGSGSYVLDIPRDHWTSSPSLDRIFGIDARHPRTTAGWLTIVHPDDRDDMARYLAEDVLAARRDFHRTYRIMRPADGEERWVEGHGRLEYDATGQVISMTGAIADVTERERTARELRHTLRRYQSLLDGGLICIHEFSRDGRILTMNDFGLALLGVDRLENIAGAQFLDLVHDKDQERVRALFDQALEGTSAEFEFVGAGPGAGRVFASSFLPLRGDDEAVAGVMGMSRDITEPRRRAEERERAQRAMRKAYAEIRTLKERLESENLLLRREVQAERVHGEIVGDSPALQQSLEQAERVADTDATVLLLGETGTGKELLAREIHRMSARRGALLLTLNCAALPEGLMERELFGHEAGAFTGARTRASGRFEAADGGTLFLDEIGELPLGLQTKLLRVLEDGRFERLGSNVSIHADVRIIAATNADLEARVEEGRFRADLYYRLNVFPIVLPPLREREGDIRLLAVAFARELSEKMGRPIRRIRTESMNHLLAYDWPGNVRELRNVIERALIRCRGDTLVIDPTSLERRAVTSPETAPSRTLKDVEREHIVDTLEATSWRVRGDGGAAEILDIHPSTLESRMRKLGIQRP